MDLSGQFTPAHEAPPAETADLLRALGLAAPETATKTATAWRDGQPITVDLTGAHPPEPRRIWPEHIAIAALFIATFAMALNHLHF